MIKVTVFVLNYDTDYGASEEWNTFYTPTEIFSSHQKRQARINELKKAVDEDGDPCQYEFHTFECVVDDTMNR